MNCITFISKTPQILTTQLVFYEIDEFLLKNKSNNS